MSKFSIGQKVYFMLSESIRSFRYEGTILGINDKEEEEITYSIRINAEPYTDVVVIPEHRVFPNRSSLLLYQESLIEKEIKNLEDYLQSVQESRKVWEKFDGEEGKEEKGD